VRVARVPQRAAVSGFSLVELAIVMAIVSFLLAGLMFTLSAQTEQRNIEETRRRLEMARDLVLSFAVVNGRLPCPARSTSVGAEARDAATGVCTSGGVEDYYGGTIATNVTGGLLPAQTIGFQQVDSGGFAVDAWQNRIRYAVAKTTFPGTCSGTPTSPHFVNATNMRANGIACQPGDLLICKSATGITSTTCGAGTANQVMTTGLVVAIFFSTGKNGATGGTGADEAANLNGASGGGNPIFVYHTPTPSTATNGEFDDQMIWITVGELYGKLIAAGQLP
jgi:prepilin-type N-terminal cleavage/methylation domain-containing protein